MRDSEKPAITRISAPATKSVAHVVVSEFREWNELHRSQDLAPAELAKGIELASARKLVMAEWIATEPELALANAISRSEYQALPQALKPYFEEPFNAFGSLRVMPDCSGGPGAATTRTLEIDGKTWNASVFGWRLGQGTKEATPLAGITLDDRAAISVSVFEILSSADAETVRTQPIGNRDLSRDFATGKPLGKVPVITLAGGKRFLFDSPAIVREVNAKLEKFDQTPGPHGGSRQLLQLASGGDGSQEIPWDQLAQSVQTEASIWTESPKSVFFIRVDFSDAVGATVTQADLTQVINTDVADSISKMSYGKTTVTATVSTMTVRMPSPKSTYSSTNNNGLLHSDAVAAYKAIAGANSLNSYHIIGVHFPAIGMGSPYAGLADVGGSRQWLQDNHSSGVIIHELGHNYGISHANFWETTDGSVVGVGANKEYGDIFDIMGGGPDPEGHFHMQAKQRLNWLDSSKWTDATATGSATYRIHRFDHESTTGVRRGVRLTKAAAPDEYYWLGYRPGIPGNPWLDNGAYLIWERPNADNCWLLDTTPTSTSGRYDAAIAIGRTYSDTAANVHITPTATGGSGADAWLDVNVQLGPFPTNTPPTATLTAPTTAAARTNVNFSVSASDPNGNPLAYYWDFGDSSVSTNSAAVTHSWTVGGSYTVNVTVTDMKGGTVTKTKVVTVTDPLNDWTAGTVAAGRTMTQVDYLDGRFIAGGNQYAYLSLNGTTWSEQYLG
ncbi:MAG TPA: PKD domain-containing protein, partial [Luteolibacter sp.]